MKIAEYLKSTPDRMWDYAAQMGVTHAVGRMPDGRMEEVASSLDRLAAMQKTYRDRGFTLDVIEPAPLNQALKRGIDGRDRELETMRALVRNMGRLGISTLCYNWTVHFNWVRNVFDFRERGGALACGYRHADWPQDELTEIGVLTREELAKFIRDYALGVCRASVADYKIPRKLQINFEPLERTPSMKIRRVVYAGTLDES